MVAPRQPKDLNKVQTVRFCSYKNIRSKRGNELAVALRAMEQMNMDFGVRDESHQGRHQDPFLIWLPAGLHRRCKQPPRRSGSFLSRVRFFQRRVGPTMGAQCHQFRGDDGEPEFWIHRRVYPTGRHNNHPVHSTSHGVPD
jgi:hypothetical protein